MVDIIVIPIVAAVVIVLLVHFCYKSKSIRDFFYHHAWKLGIIGAIGGAIIRITAV